MQGFWNLIGKSGQGPGKDFQYEISEKISSSLDTKSLWSLHHGKKKVSGEIVSVFVCDGKTASPEELHLAKAACKRLKTLRHPNIIKFLDAFESESLVYVITEPVIPLSTFLDEEDGRNPNLITWGLHQVIAGLSFLINNGNLLHENVNIYSIFVGLEGEWKLGGVEYVHAANTDSVAKLPCLSCYNPPEVNAPNKRKEKWSSDAWGLGCLIWEIYNGALQNPSDLKNIKKIPKPLVVHYCDLVSANPKSRTNPKVFLERTTEPGQFLCNDFIKANLFLAEIQIKDQKEQKDFFSSLDKTLDSFPKQFCIYKVLPQLLNAFEYGTAGSAVLSPLFKVGLLLDDTAYQTKIVPCIIKLFSSNDRATRIQLLQQMEKFAKHLQPSVVDTQIFPCVATGFGDTLPAMREQTIKAMLLLAPKLSEKTINNNLLRYFAKLQMDEQPGIRTNTTICLGKIAEYFSPATRQKVLIPAFTRALRDPFPPARRAGVLAIAGTQEYYSMNEVSGKVLPALCASLVDPEKTVRDCTFSLVKAFLKKLEEFSKNPDSALNNKEVAEKEAANSGNTWTGWAVTSITSRFYQQQQQQQQQQQKQESQPPSATEAGSKIENKSTTQEAVERTHGKLDIRKKDVEEDVSDNSDYNDAWGDEDWQDVKEESSLGTKDQGPPLRGFDVKTKDVGNDSDSDYGDEWGDSGWGEEKTADAGGWGVDTNDWGNDTTDDWGGNSWTANTGKKSVAKKEAKQNKKKAAEPSVAELLGMTADSNDFLTGKPGGNESAGWTDDFGDVSESFSAKPFSSGASKTVEITSFSNDWGNNSWGDNTDDWGDNDEKAKAKEQRRLELQRKREERKQQREHANKEKKTAKNSGALKLGAVKKGT